MARKQVDRTEETKEAALLIKGKRQGFLTIGDYVSGHNLTTLVFHVKCDCGNEKDMKWTDLIYKRVRSCGCGANSENWRALQEAYAKDHIDAPLRRKVRQVATGYTPSLTDAERAEQALERRRESKRAYRARKRLEAAAEKAEKKAEKKKKTVKTVRPDLAHIPEVNTFIRDDGLELTCARLYRLWENIPKSDCCSAWTNADEFIRWGILSGYSKGKVLVRKNPKRPWHPLNCEWRQA